MRFGYYDRLSRANKEIYRKSDAIETLGLPRGLELGPTVQAIEAALLARSSSMRWSAAIGFRA